MTFFDELKRRNVFRAGIAYVVGGWLLLQVSDVVLPNIGAPDWVFRVILLLLVAGFPLVLIIAYVFELTSEGFKRETNVDHPEAVPGSYGRQIDFAIIALLTVAVGYFAYDKFASTRKTESDKSIAVLPLENWTGDENQEYFATGLSEELLNLLTKIPALRVIARTSSFAYQGKDAKISDIARELDVDHVLQGSVRGVSNAKVRISVQLIQADDESQMWGETFDRELSDIFAIQDEIAESVVDELKLRFLNIVPKARQTDPEAYRLYLQARELSPQANEPDPEQAIEAFMQALEIEPTYAAAWTGLAENHIYIAEKARIESIRTMLGSDRCSSKEPLEPDRDPAYYIGEAFEEARCAANTALRIDPENSLALASLGRIAMVYDGNLAVAAKHLERALELDPANAHIIRQVAILSGNLNRLDEAVELLEYAVARDPISPAVHSNLALNYYYAREWKKAISAYRAALRLNSNPVGIYSWIGLTHVFNKQPGAGLVEIEKERHPDGEKDHVERRPWRLIGQAIAYHALDRKKDSDAALNQLIDDYGEEWSFSIAYVLAFRGEADRAFEWLYRARDQRDPGLSEIASEPAFDNIRSDSRWLEFLGSIGKAPEQLDAIEFKVARTE